MIKYPEELANYYISKYEDKNEAIYYIKQNGNIDAFKGNLILEFKKLEHIIFQYEKAFKPNSLNIDQCYLNILSDDRVAKTKVSLSLFKEIPYSKMIVYVSHKNTIFPKESFAESYLSQGSLSLTEKEYFVTGFERYIDIRFRIKEFNDTIRYDIAEAFIDFIFFKFIPYKSQQNFLIMKLVTVYLQTALILQIIEFIFRKKLEKNFNQCDIFSTDPIVLEKLNLSLLKTDFDMIAKIDFVKEKIKESNILLHKSATTLNDMNDFFEKLGIKIS